MPTVANLTLEVAYSRDGYREKYEQFNSFHDAFQFANQLDGSCEWIDIVCIGKDGTRRTVQKDYRL